MDLIIKNKLIDAPITKMLYRLKQDIGDNYLDFIGPEQESGVRITCPYHAGGHEKTPDCYVYNHSDNPKIYYGTMNCFACGAKRPFYSLVGHCLGGDDELGKEWLVTNFGETIVDRKLFIEPLEIEESKKNKEQVTYLNESILDQYNYIHQYILNRKVSREVCERFRVGYDIEHDMITFPIWDYSGGLVAINKRSVKGKFYDLAKGINKAVYLLNFIREDYYNNINHPFVVVCESQINALTLWSIGVPAIALMGTGSKDQYEILRNSIIKNYVLMFDGDIAGRHGAEKFIKNMNNDCFITDIKMPSGKDVNDLETNELVDLLNSYGLKYRINNN